MRIDGLNCVPCTRWQHLLTDLVFSCCRSTVFVWKDRVLWWQPMHSWPVNTKKQLFIFIIFEWWWFEYRYLASWNEDSDDGELSSSSGDDKDSLEVNTASASQWSHLALFHVIKFSTQSRSFPSEIAQGCLAYSSEESCGACNCFFIWRLYFFSSR